MAEKFPFRVIERGTGMFYAKSRTLEGARRNAKFWRDLRDREGLHTNRIDVYQLIDEEEES